MKLEGRDMKPSLHQLKPKLVCECSEYLPFRALLFLPREEVDRIILEHEE